MQREVKESKTNTQTQIIIVLVHCFGASGRVVHLHTAFTHERFNDSISNLCSSLDMEDEL